MANAPKPQPPLLQRAALQTQANRYAFLQKLNNGKLIDKIVKA